MALEPKVVSLEDERNPELEDMNRRFWICLGPSLFVMFLAMVEMIPGLSFPEVFTGSTRNWVQWRWRRRWCSGAAGRFFSEGGLRW